MEVSMNKEKKLLLWAIISAIIYLLLEYFVFSKIDVSKLMNEQNINIDTNVDTISTIITYVLYFIGIAYFSFLVFFKNIDLNKHKTGIMVWSIIFLLLNIISGVLGLIAASSLKKKKVHHRYPNYCGKVNVVPQF